MPNELDPMSQASPQVSIVVPLYDRQDPRELAVMLRNAEPRVLVAATHSLADPVIETPDTVAARSFQDLACCVWAMEMAWRKQVSASARWCGDRRKRKSPFRR